jgi:hypothetical protein
MPKAQVPERDASESQVSFHGSGANAGRIVGHVELLEELDKVGRREECE